MSALENETPKRGKEMHNFRVIDGDKAQDAPHAGARREKRVDEDGNELDAILPPRELTGQRAIDAEHGLPSSAEHEPLRSKERVYWDPDTKELR